jgi:hypothetical protein
MWAAFMKAATRGDKREWLSPPPGIVTATVCRLSGKLATRGCERADVVVDGTRRERMVYSEYFVRGTEPTTSCLLHGTRGFFGAIAAFFSGRERPSHHVEVIEPDPPPAPPSVEPATRAPQPQEPPAKKRGFWSRVFGGGRDKAKKGQDQ